MLISAIDAGRTRICVCGIEYQVPKLMELRSLEAAGELTIPAIRVMSTGFDRPMREPIYSEAYKLQMLDLRGRLPLERNCLKCGVETQGVLECHIECEMPEQQSNGPLNFVVALFHAFHSPVHALLHFFIHQEDEPEQVGREVVVHAPLRICPGCSANYARNKQTIRELLLKMRLYQPLFREYPQAEIRL